MIRIKIWNLATKLKHHNRQPIVHLGIKSGAIGRKSQLFYVNSPTATPINLIWKMHTFILSQSCTTRNAISNASI